MKNQVCKLVYHSYGKTTLDTFANGVKNGIFSNPTVFTTPPHPEDELKNVITGYSTNLAEYEAYGKIKKTPYLVSKDKLMSVLDEFAVYVNGVAYGDPSIILMAGFIPTANGSQAAPALSKIESVFVTPSKVNGQVFIETPAIVGKGVSGYGLILVGGTPLTMDNFLNGVLNLTPSTDQQIIMDLSKGRRKTVNGLDSNIQYYGYMYATNSTSVSPLSDAKLVKSI